MMNKTATRHWSDAWRLCFRCKKIITHGLLCADCAKQNQYKPRQ
jgi:hypothetical protein